MPLHLLGKKSWNVYGSDNIARVKADEAAAAAREAAEDQRMQALDAERRVAILRGRTPPPFPEEQTGKAPGSRRPGNADDRGHDRKRRKLAGEDDTDVDIRMARSITARPDDEAKDTRVLKLRSTASDAPLQNHAGNIDLFPLDVKEAIRHERNAKADKEKRNKEKALEDQYTMRFSNAAGKAGIDRPWYATVHEPVQHTRDKQDLALYQGFVNKDVWGNEDPRRKERELARISTNDPFAFMQKAQAQLKKSKQDRKQWAEERDRELRELRSAQEREERRSRHLKRKRRDADDTEHRTSKVDGASLRPKHRYEIQSRSRDRHEPRSSHRSDKRRAHSKTRERDGDRRSHHDRRDGDPGKAFL
jgi:hypothetical protein